MNDELQKSLAEIVKALTDAASKVGGVAQEQLPLLVQEYLSWGVVSYSYLCGAFLLLAVVALTVAAFVRKALVRERDADKSGYRFNDDGYWTGIFLALCAAFGGLVGVAFNAYGLVRVLVAPRVYLLEQVAQLVK